MKLMWLLFVFFSLPSRAADTDQLTSLKGTDYQLIRSAILDHDYHIYVKVPEQAKAEPNKKWPVVYLLDGGNNFPLLTPYAEMLSWFGDLPPVVMVGISYGTRDWQQGNNRSHDFTLPAEGREHYGGAEKFHQFLSKELMPKITSQFPVDSKQNFLFGHSLGGQFGLYVTMFHPKTFQGVIASNPAIHRNTASFLEGLEDHSTQPMLFMMQADMDDERFKNPRQQWLEYWHDKPHHWLLNEQTIVGHNHMSSLPSAFRQGMIWFFQQQAHPRDRK